MTNPQTCRQVNRREGERGFALLVIFLMAAAVSIALYIEMPRVAFESQRNREELLVQRGEQYKRGIELYYRKMKTYPQKMEDLENTNNFRFLRKRYKDPLTGKDEWRIIHMGPAGLTDSLVEKMPGLDGNKTKDGKEMASNGSSSSTTSSTDPNAPKDADDITAGSNRTERDQRALLAQRGGATGLPAQFDPNNPNAGQQGAPVDPNQAFQQEQLRKYQEQMALQQQQQQGNQQNPGAPPMSQMNAGGMQAPAMPNPNGDPNANPFNNPQQQQQNQQNQNQFPPVGSQNGPVRTLFQPGQMPFNPGNAMIRGAIPNPAGGVANSQTGGEFQPPNPFAQPQQTTMTGGPGQQNSFNVPQAVRNQLTNPLQRPTTGQNQAFGGGGIAGIASNAGGSGIKRYGERSKYKEWEFVYDYRKPGKGAKKGVTGVGGLNTTNGTNGQQTPNSGFGNQGGGSFGSGGNPGGNFGNSGGFGGNNNSGGFGSNPRRP
jgi:hypothetical protein